MWATEASRPDMLDAHGESVYSWRRLLAAVHRCGPFAMFTTYWAMRTYTRPLSDAVSLGAKVR